MRIYITGGTGFVGGHILQAAVEHGAQVFTPTHSWRPNGPVPFHHAPVDLQDGPAIQASVEAFQPDVIVHSAILTDMKRMYADRRLAWRMYVDATRHLIRAANQVGAHFILISTDWVFDGTQAPADETTPPNPVNLYGVLKVVCETLALETAAQGAVARVAGVNGWHRIRSDFTQHQNPGFGFFVGALVESLRRGEPFTVWTGPVNMRATPTLADDIGGMVMAMAARRVTGVFHCCGREAIDRVALAQAAVEVFGLDPFLLRVGPVDQSDPGALPGIPIPRDSSLDNRATVEALGYTPQDVRGMLETMHRQRPSSP